MKEHDFGIEDTHPLIFGIEEEKWSMSSTEDFIFGDIRVYSESKGM